MSFDTAAKTWDTDESKIERARKLAETIQKNLKGTKPDCALELGAGTGLLSFFLKDNFSSIDLADASDGMLEVLREKIQGQGVNHFNPIMLENFSQLESKKYDMSYSLMTMHHIPDLEDAFTHFNRILKPGGILVIADLVKESGDFHHAADSKHVHHGFEKEKLIAQLTEKGFFFVDYQIFYTIEKVTELGERKPFPLFALVLQKVQ